MPLKQSRSSFCCHSFTYSCAHNYLKAMYLHGTWVSQLTHPHLPCANTWDLWQQRQSLHQLTRCSSLPPSHFQPPGIVSLGVIYGAPGSASLAHRGDGTFGELVLLSGWIWCKGKMGGGSHLEVLLGRVLQHPFSTCPRAIRQLKVLLGDTTRSRAASAPLISETARICHVEISRWSDSPKHTPYYEDVQKPLPVIPFTQRKSLPDLAPGEWFNALYTNGTGHTAAGETVYPTEQQPRAEGTSPCSLLCNSLGIWYCQFFFVFKNSWKVLISQLRPFFPHLYISSLFLQHAVFSCSPSYLHWLGCFQAGTGRWMKKWVLQEKVY